MLLNSENFSAASGNEMFAFGVTQSGYLQGEMTKTETEEVKFFIACANQLLVACKQLQSSTISDFIQKLQLSIHVVRTLQAVSSNVPSSFLLHTINSSCINLARFHEYLFLRITHYPKLSMATEISISFLSGRNALNI